MSMSEEFKRKDLMKPIILTIGQYGSFSTADVMAESSPIVFSLGNMTVLAEYFDEEDVECHIYHNDNLLEVVDVSWEKLPLSTLENIVELCEDWKEENQ